MNTKTLTWVLFIFLSLTWGSSFILMKKSMYPVGEEMVLDPYQVGALRMLVAATLLLPIALKSIRKVTKKNFIFLLISGTCGNFIPSFLFTMSETRIDTSLAGLLNMSTTFFVTLIGIFVYRALPSKFQVIGLLVGSGGLYMVLQNQINFDNGDLGYAMLVILATVCYAISLTTIKFKLADLKATEITSLSFMMILLPALVASIYFDAFEPIATNENAVYSVSYLAILSVVGTAIAVLLFTRLIAISSHIFASAVAYMLPIVALFLGIWLDGEKFNPINILWISLIFGGVYLMNHRASKRVEKKGSE